MAPTKARAAQDRTGVRRAGLTALAMAAFAANSVLNRAALAEGLADPVAFAAIRTVSGALILLALALPRTGWPRARRPGAALALTLYMLGFSLAYLALDAGTGALILFGGVQVTMFAAALIAREPVPARRWAGAALALAGLAWLLRPQGAGEGPWALAMAAAALGWGLYTLSGRGARDPLTETAANFVLAAPLTLAALAVAALAGGLGPVTPAGAALGVLSGAVTSGLGYALWYAVLPGLDRTTAALAQLTVPVIAVLGGLALLGETPRPATLAAGAMVLLGVGLGLVPRRAR